MLYTVLLSFSAACFLDFYFLFYSKDKRRSPSASPERKSTKKRDSYIEQREKDKERRYNSHVLTFDVCVYVMGSLCLANDDQNPTHIIT